MKKELILGIDSAGMLNKGLTKYSRELYHLLFDEKNIWIGPREKLESVSAIKQIIPYVIISEKSKPNGVLIYKRSQNGGESRLTSKWSLGFGGHINLADLSYKNEIDINTTIMNAAARELNEELGITSFEPENVGVLLDDDNVGNSHIGVVMRAWLDYLPSEIECSDEIERLEYANLYSLKECSHQLEGWSRIILANISTKITIL